MEFGVFKSTFHELVQRRLALFNDKSFSCTLIRGTYVAVRGRKIYKIHLSYLYDHYNICKNMDVVVDSFMTLIIDQLGLEVA